MSIKTSIALTATVALSLSIAYSTFILMILCIR
jgi:hypothetical protein